MVSAGQASVQNAQDGNQMECLSIHTQSGLRPPSSSTARNDDEPPSLFPSNKYSRPALSWGWCVGPIPELPFSFCENMAFAAFRVGFFNIRPNCAQQAEGKEKRKDKCLSMMMS